MNNRATAAIATPTTATAPPVATPAANERRSRRYSVRRRSRSEAESQTQQVAFDLRTEYDTAQKNAEVLEIYRDGLLPQARAEFEAGVAAYQNNRQDFQPLLTSFLDVLQLDEEYWKSAAERETALAKIEQLTGLPLREEEEKK